LQELLNKVLQPEFSLLQMYYDLSTLESLERIVSIVVKVATEGISLETTDLEHFVTVASCGQDPNYFGISKNVQ